MRKINVLGTEYEILIQSSKENAKLVDCNGLCEQYSKKIILNNFEEEKKDVMCVEKLEELEKMVLRHEIFHAFFGESGLRGQCFYAENEELIDWLAIQSPKIFKVFAQLDIL